MNYEFYFFGFIPLYTLINAVITFTIYKKWIKNDVIVNAYPDWKTTFKPSLLVVSRLLLLLISYFTPWIFLSSTRAFLINLFIFLPVHLLVDQAINSHLSRKSKLNKF